MTAPALIRETFPVGPLQCNCTIIGDPVSKKAIVVDPGGNPDNDLCLCSDRRC
jgi:hydroxyacylglutathione hydrolase